MTDDGDFALLERWRAGDQSAGQTLVRRHTPTLHRFFASKAPEAIEDLVQGTFLACVETRDRFRADAAFRTYALGIARKLLFKHYRKQLRGHRALALEAVCAEQVSGSPSLAAAARQEMRMLVPALRQIPIDQQIAIELYYWEELPIAEIAEILEVAEGTVKSRLARARDQLRATILAGVPASPARQNTLDELDRWAKDVRGD
jgi:RNA polymerase sigma-70 factor (ECF subfamily)